VKQVNLPVITCANFTCTEQYNVSLTDGSKLIGLSYIKWQTIWYWYITIGSRILVSMMIYTPHTMLQVPLL